MAQEQGSFTQRVARVVRGVLAEHGVTGTQVGAALSRSSGYVSERQTGLAAWTIADLEMIGKLLGMTGPELLLLIVERERGQRAPVDAEMAALLTHREPRDSTALLLGHADPSDRTDSERSDARGRMGA